MTNENILEILFLNLRGYLLQIEVVNSAFQTVQLASDSSYLIIVDTHNKKCN